MVRTSPVFFFSHFLIHSCVCLSLCVQYSSWARIRLQDILRLKEREIRRKKKRLVSFLHSFHRRFKDCDMCYTLLFFFFDLYVVRA